MLIAPNIAKKIRSSVLAALVLPAVFFATQLELSAAKAQSVGTHPADLSPTQQFSTRVEPLSGIEGINQDNPRQADPKRLKELRQRIRDLKHRKIQRALNLDDESARKFFDSYRPAERDIEKLVHDRNAALRDLYRDIRINGNAVTDSDIESRMAEIRHLNGQIEKRWVELDKDLKPLISPKQRVQLLMFEKRFNERLRKELVERRMERNPDFRRRVEDWRKFRGNRGRNNRDRNNHGGNDHSGKDRDGDNRGGKDREGND